MQRHNILNALGWNAYNTNWHGHHKWMVWAFRGVGDTKHRAINEQHNEQWDWRHAIWNVTG